MSGCYPPDVSGNESYFNPDTTAECPICGCEYDTEQVKREDRCPDCQTIEICEFCDAEYDSGDKTTSRSGCPDCEQLSECCGAEIKNGLCADCKEHC